jgi:ABC-type multidrug transport system ATPase subunit
MQSGQNLTIELKDLGKKFGNEWIFKNLDRTIPQGQKLVILGGNGSGKSTLLQVIAGYVLPNHGKVNYSVNGSVIENDVIKDHISLASPYLELIEEFTLEELIDHIALYKPFINKLTSSQIIEVTELGSAKNKPVRTFSSGMKQRVKLALAILADCEVLLLDEPVSNLDKNAIEWYKHLISKYASHKTIIVCSNSINDEFGFCDKEIDLGSFK